MTDYDRWKTTPPDEPSPEVSECGCAIDGFDCCPDGCRCECHDGEGALGEDDE